MQPFQWYQEIVRAKSSQYFSTVLLVLELKRCERLYTWTYTSKGLLIVPKVEWNAALETGRESSFLSSHVLTFNMPLFIKLSKSRGLIVVFMVLMTCRFGSSPPLQKRSGNCSCSLSCAEMPKLRKNERVEVHVQNQSAVIYNKIREVSSLFNDEGQCSVVVPDCLQEDEKVEFRIFPIKGNRAIYEKMDLNPECKTEKPAEESNKLTDGENKTHSVTKPPEDVGITDGVKVTIVLCVGLAIAGGIGVYICWRKYQQQQNII